MLAWGVVPLPLFRRFSAIAMGWPATRGKGSPTTNAAERALLEGYRMGVNSSSKGKAQGKGDGKDRKGGGKGTPAGGSKIDRTCQREGCRAAHKQQATFGGAANCFVCGLSLHATLPVEQLVQWAFDASLELNKQKAAPPVAPATTDATQPKTAAGTPATLTAEQLTSKRTDRLALMKAAKAGEEIAAPTITQEVARVFVGAAQPPKRLVLDKEAMEEVKDLDSAAAAILEALQLECMPAEDSLKPPKEILETLLAKSNHTKKDSGKTIADQALQVSRDALKAMRSSGMEEDDELLKLMVAREAQQAKEARTLNDKQPSKKSRILTLEAIKSDFAKSTGEQADGRATGAAKAAERATARSKTADALIEAAKKLKCMVTESATRLNEAHRARAQMKEQQGAEVLNLMGEKLKALLAEPAEDILIIDEDEVGPATATEHERDEAKRLTELLTLQLQQLKTAAAGAQAQSAVPAEAATPTATQLWQDLTLDFPAEPSQLPAHSGIGAELKEAATKLHTLLQKVPWGSSLPAVQFMHLDIQPCDMHGMVGDAIWQACWGERQTAITPQHAVPYKLLHIAKSVAENLTLTVTEEQRTSASGRYAKVVKDATARRNAGGPY